MTRPKSRDKDMAESGLRWTGRVQPCLPLGPLTEFLEQIGWSIINIRQKKGLVTRGKDNRLAQGDGQEGLSRAKTAWVQTPALSLFNCKLLKPSPCPFSYLKDDCNNTSRGFPGSPTVKNTACDTRDPGFDLWSGKIPHASEQLSPCSATEGPAVRRPLATTREIPSCSHGDPA